MLLLGHLVWSTMLHTRCIRRQVAATTTAFTVLHIHHLRSFFAGAGNGANEAVGTCIVVF
ncbi:hypothetical protein U9M48_041140 [Paspalum notatum var. saurae]|uniref:Uncharacterized protein n=1 Tax=Paspalum notatum var. saurae TaxID=547442 RepID=A0AAQ3XDW2_PASNO